ncbi:alpha-ketoacid dehydrogenase subunit beta [Acidiferrimicrobium sp. IK]|uniref:alpha-ketoacid dehydrogenase subunit beta n=1 Tax=Acidiferrimicrobium sp. IK TaxID=2871700 RepID=UPI0021CB0CB1|nr:alpha-ketoacid dehydrogenase subunit beta [Acidiferrimicrobium sp. IK]MCU4184964.1 alpha-ketoacid dehydrogenase subunit beta [Acidiferrimicrobium sp. IK]
MREGGVTYLDAVTAALEDEMTLDERVVLIGEDIGVMGGAFRATRGLFDRFGAERVIDTPISETAIVGGAIGMAIAGLRPVAELQFADFISCAYDQIVTEAAKLHYRFGVPVPLVIRAPSGGGVGAGPFHSQNPEGIFAHVPGLKVVCPWSVQDAYHLLRAAIRDPNPVLFFEHKALYRSQRGDLTRSQPAQPLGRAAVRRSGGDVTLLSYGGLVGRCLEVADLLHAEGASVEVIDLRTVYPLDIETILASVTKTSRLVVVHEDTLSSGIGAEVAARVAEHAFHCLDAPIRRITAPDTPVPFALPLETAFIPSASRIAEGVRACLTY